MTRKHHWETEGTASKKLEAVLLHSPALVPLNLAESIQLLCT